MFSSLVAFPLSLLQTAEKYETSCILCGSASAKTPLLPSYTKLYEALAMTRVHLSPVQHCRHTLLYIYIWALIRMFSPPACSPSQNKHSRTKYIPKKTKQNCTQKKGLRSTGYHWQPFNPIPAPTCSVLWFIRLEWLMQGAQCLQNPACCSRGTSEE